MDPKPSTSRDPQPSTSGVRSSYQRRPASVTSDGSRPASVASVRSRSRSLSSSWDDSRPASVVPVVPEDDDVVSVKNDENTEYGVEKIVDDSRPASVVPVVPKDDDVVSVKNDENTEYDVEKIVDHRFVRDHLQYRIKWKDYSPKDNSWEPVSSLSCPELIADYHRAATAAWEASRMEEEDDATYVEPGHSEVERILTHKFSGDRLQFLVQWKNYNSDYNTWVGVSGLSCAELITEYRATCPDDVPPVKHKRKPKVYEVAAIVGHRVRRNKNEYLLRWKGYTKAHDTWESEDRMKCKDLLDMYKRTNGGPVVEIVTVRLHGGQALRDSLYELYEHTSFCRKCRQQPRKGVKVKPIKTIKTIKTIDKIVDEKQVKGRTYYLVKWEGLAGDTWEPFHIVAASTDKYREYMSYKESLIPFIFEEVLVAQKIVADQTKDHVKHYMIQWKRHPLSSATWQTASALARPDLINRYEASKVRAAKRKAVASKRHAAKKPLVAADSGSDDDGREVESYSYSRLDDDGSKMVLVRWKGRDASQDNWVREDHPLVQQFIREQNE